MEDQFELIDQTLKIKDNQLEEEVSEETVEEEEEPDVVDMVVEEEEEVILTKVNIYLNIRIIISKYILL